MALEIGGRSVERVHIVDDDPNARKAYGYSVEDLNLQPLLEEGPLHDLDQFIENMHNVADAVICDHHLRVKNYASFNGAETVARLYGDRLPAILCTRYLNAHIDEMRRYRRKIPVLLKPDELDPDSLRQGFEQCIKEFKGEYRPSRRSWKTLIRVEDVDNAAPFFYVVIPGWDTNEVIRLLLEHVSPEIQAAVKNQKWFHAKVNLGAERQEELYFEEWEID